MTRAAFSMGLVADELTSACLSGQCHTLPITPLNYRWVLRRQRPDVLFVESVWHGHRNAWKYRVAAYPDQPRRNNRTLAKVVGCARDLGIPTVFWNKEDGVHFDRFIGSAKLFDHVFTVDETCVERYRAVMGRDASVHVLMFAVAPQLHSFSGFDFKVHRANFLGSYSQHIHSRRRAWQHMLFEGAAAELGLTVFDRNSARPSSNYRYPQLPDLQVHPAVDHSATADIYKHYLVSLNVNTVEDSTTMFSRRLLEILACGGIAVTTPARSVDLLFKDFCHVVRDPHETHELFVRLRQGPTRTDLERAAAGAAYVAQHFTWAQRLEQVAQIAL